MEELKIGDILLIKKSDNKFFKGSGLKSVMFYLGNTIVMTVDVNAGDEEQEQFSIPNIKLRRIPNVGKLLNKDTRVYRHPLMSSESACRATIEGNLNHYYAPDKEVKRLSGDMRIVSLYFIETCLRYMGLNDKQIRITMTRIVKPSSTHMITHHISVIPIFKDTDNESINNERNKMLKQWNLVDLFSTLDNDLFNTELVKNRTGIYASNIVAMIPVKNLGYECVKSKVKPTREHRPAVLTKNNEVNMFINKKLKVGDILSYKVDSKNPFLNLIFKIQRYIDRTKYNHTALYVGNGLVMEMCASIGGRRYRAVSEYELSPNCTVQRYAGKYNKVEMKLAIDEYLSSHKDSSNYSYDGLIKEAIGTGIEFVLESILNVGLFDVDVEIGLGENDRESFCSEMVSEIYEIYFNRINSNERRLALSDTPSPGDIGKSTLLFNVDTKDYWN